MAEDFCIGNGFAPRIFFIGHFFSMTEEVFFGEGLHTNYGS